MVSLVLPKTVTLSLTLLPLSINQMIKPLTKKLLLPVGSEWLFFVWGKKLGFWFPQNSDQFSFLTFGDFVCGGRRGSFQHLWRIKGVGHPSELSVSFTGAVGRFQCRVFQFCSDSDSFICQIQIR